MGIDEFLWRQILCAVSFAALCRWLFVSVLPRGVSIAGATIVEKLYPIFFGL